MTSHGALFEVSVRELRRTCRHDQLDSGFGSLWRPFAFVSTSTEPDEALKAQAMASTQLCGGLRVDPFHLNPGVPVLVKWLPNSCDVLLTRAFN